MFYDLYAIGKRIKNYVVYLIMDIKIDLRNRTCYKSCTKCYRLKTEMPTESYGLRTEMPKIHGNKFNI